MDSLTLKSHAKINIGLQVLNQRQDGYHNLHTIFQELDFHDTITLTKTDRNFELSSTTKDFPLDKSNTCHKAYSLLKKEFPDIGGVHVHVDKQIPQGAGLGGGSSNGAAILKGLNQLCELGLSDYDLEQIAVKIGADVPFFIQGGCQLGEGIGEKLTPISKRLPYSILLAVPPVSISTSWAYKGLKNGLEAEGRKANFADLFRRDEIPFELFKNDFERIVIPAHPEIGRIKDALIKNGALYASLSGSGSTVFGMFDEDTAASAAESVLPSSTRTILSQPTHI